MGESMKVCMVAYAQYISDARIKAYVRSIENTRGMVDLLVLKEDGKPLMEVIGNSRVFYLTDKYQGVNPVRYILSYLKFFFVCLFRLSWLFLKERYDAIHVHNMPNFIVYTAILPRLFGKKVILDVHDLMTANYIVKFGLDEESLLIRCLRLEQKVSSWFANRVLCADHMQKIYLQEKCSIPEEKILVFMNLPHKDLFKPVKRLKEDKEKFHLVYHGTIAERLGIDFLLYAIARIKNIIPVRLFIYGAGDYLETAISIRDQLLLEDVVYFSKSFFPVEEISKILSDMDLGIIPYRKNQVTENFGMPVKLLEYAYLKIPIIAPRFKIIKYYFTENMVKFYEPENVESLAQCIVDLFSNPEERRTLVENAQKFYKKNNWENQEISYLRLFNQMVCR
jgi:glycosyltransferase involved in cell wall biosynthesis